MRPGKLITVGTAGHIDHGKTALVKALTGCNTDRLPEERRRGISIDLGFAELDLGNGRSASLVDVPGHERFVRTMIAGATGIDYFLLAIAADDGVMPQTREHFAILQALGVKRGAVALTRCDVATEEQIAAHRSAAARLVPGVPIVETSACTGVGVDELRETIAGGTSGLLYRLSTEDTDPPVLHIDRVFTVRGHGTVVTGTLWSGTIERGDRVRILPQEIKARVRSVESHNRPLHRAVAHTRVALNLAGIGIDEVARGDVISGDARGPVPTWRLDVTLTGKFVDDVDGTRVQIHHGTRESPARVVLGLRRGIAHLRLERPLLALAGDRLVLRSIAPPDTLGGGVVLNATPPRRGRARLRQRDSQSSRDKTWVPVQVPTKLPSMDSVSVELLTVVRRSGATAPSVPDLAAAIGLDEQETRERLRSLRELGKVCEAGRDVWFAADVLQALESRVLHAARSQGSISLAGARDELRTSRRCAQAILEHLGGRYLIREGDRHRLRR